ncbi:BLOC-1-related complex subunit 8 homolog isoform X2 [Macadamia integrifolia]|uniref:BLOC-1-related complex subunit 8 homolog isoform X2 n=1 Tax=Macadamia integrifolia TaxID=60698 RepID=UPI001C4FBC62|nr:BLOC-1-related complex subunit 8 homolog isoform X2 [Macadamia integrifolia]
MLWDRIFYRLRLSFVSFLWLLCSFTKKMHGFSIVDGFMNVNESLAEMIKYVANEPSVGLFYVQQHTQNAVPSLLNVKDKVGEKCRETTLHTDDLEDSLTMLKSMKECGLHLTDEMIKDIKKSVVIMSSAQPQRGLIHNQKSSFETGKSSPWGAVTYDHNAFGMQQDEASHGNYISSVLKLAKQRALGLRWPELNSKQQKGPEGQETDELPLSSRIVDEQLDEAGSGAGQNLASLFENYDDFRATREVKLKEWLEGPDNLNNTQADILGSTLSTLARNGASL